MLKVERMNKNCWQMMMVMMMMEDKGRCEMWNWEIELVCRA